MRTILNARAMFLDRSVLLLIVSLNLTVLSKLKLTSETLMGAFNGSLAGSLLVASLWRPASYAQCRWCLLLLCLPLCLLLLCLPLLPATSHIRLYARGALQACLCSSAQCLQRTVLLPTHHPTSLCNTGRCPLYCFACWCVRCRWSTTQ